MFISYKWEIQETVKSLVSKLREAGYRCWMDISQMGAGDRMNEKISEGISNSKVSSNKALNKRLSLSLQGHRLWTLWSH